MDYILHSKKQIEELKKEMGINGINELIKDIPEAVRFNDDLNLPGPYTELEINEFISDLKTMNNIDYLLDLKGAGIYRHFIPAAVSAIANRSEFVTAYTPYQAELSQGLLQSIFEYQSCIANLTGMEVCNASLYDGATSLYEAAKLAINATRRKKIVISKYVHPEYLEVLRSCLAPLEDVEIIEFEDVSNIKQTLDDNTACVIISNPNFLGRVEDVELISNIAHDNGSLLIVSTYPIALGILEKPGLLGADVVVAEGQCLGMPPVIGGATLGIFATKKKYIRLMPGRIVGMTTDADDNPGFVLTMQAREQHIRREKALSNICSNHAHYALRALIYMSLIGDSGLRNVAKLSMDNAYYLNQKLKELDCFEVMDNKGFFNEFVVKLNDKYDFDEFNKKLKENRIDLGVRLNKYYKEFDRHWLVCATEMTNKKDIDKAVNVIPEIVKRLASSQLSGI